MSTTTAGPCPTARQLWERTHCLRSVSKDVKGELTRLDLDHRKCETEAGSCATLVTDHLLRARLESHEPCDDRRPNTDGELVVRRLVTTFRDDDGHNRGVHAGEFRWRSKGLVIEGRLRGMTNVGTHRRPAFDDCQECHSPGMMEGVLCGRIVKARDRGLVGDQVTASYRFRFDPSKEFQDTAFTGTIEGVVIHDCEGKPGGGRDCLDLTGLPVGTNPNPWTIAGHTFEVRDHTGAVMPTTEIVSWSATTGLHAWFDTTITLPTPAASVDITLVHYSSPATVTAYDASGAATDSATMTLNATPETLHLTGPGITSLQVKAPQDETLILRVCHTPQ